MSEEGWNDLSWDDRGKKLRQDFEALFPPFAETMPEPVKGPGYWMEETYDDYIIVTGDGKAYKVLFEVDDEGEITFAAPDDWIEVIAKKWIEAAQMGELIPLADFAEAGTISVQVARPGSFMEKHGREVVITEADLDEYVANFMAGIAGQELPIFQGHPAAATRPEEPAAAWYKRLFTQVVDGVKTLWADIELSDLGRKLIAKKLYKYFSPTIDLKNKIISGGGFVNLPAIKGMAQMELSESQFLREAKSMTFVERVKQALEEIFKEPDVLADLSSQTNIEPGGENEMTDEERMQLEAKIRNDIEAEFAEKAQTEAEMTERITADVRAKVEAEFAEKAKREADLSEFVREVTEGEAALSTPPDKLTATLMLLSEDQLAAIKPVLKAKVVDFSEHGHSGAGAQLKTLPEGATIALRRRMSSATDVKKAVVRFCEANGFEMQEYDLSEFLPKEEK